jgi:hypothetical protein
MAAVAAVAGPASPARATRTYGGKRTFQESADISVDAAPRQSYAELRKRYEVDNDDDEGGRNLLAELQLARAPEPISDMRSKGESKRFTDEIAYLLGGIKDPGLALRRNSSVELLRNMQDGGWVTKLDVHGETEHIFEALVAARGDDEVMDVVVLLFIAILSATSLNTILHADLQTIISVVISNLGKKAGPLDVAYKGKVTRAVSMSYGCSLTYRSSAFETLRSSWVTPAGQMTTTTARGK